MRKRVKELLAALLCLSGCHHASKPPVSEPFRWAAYYETKRPATDFEDLDLVVFDGRHHPSLRKMQNHTLVLAYIPIGETYHDVPERELLEVGGHVLYKNEAWNSYVIDMRAKQWQEMVMGYVERAVGQGFDGVMLDTVDSPLEWARQQGPVTYAEMQEAAVGLIHEIHKKYPDLKIMQNRGFVIAPQTIFDIDYLLAESVLTRKSETTGQYDQLPSKEYEKAVEQLHQIVARREQVRILTLDYWDMGDVDNVEKLYAKQRAAGFHPYVTTPDLQQFTPEPVH